MVRRRQVISASALLIGGLLLTACSNGSTSSARSGATSNGATPTSSGNPTNTSGNGEAAKSADQILADADQATSAASSVHISGSGTSSGSTIRLDVVDGHGRGGGSISLAGATFDTVLDGQIIYLRADAASWSKLSSGNAAIATLLAGKWLRTTTSNQDFSDFPSLLDISKVVSNLTPSGTVTKGPVTRVNRVAVIPLKDNGPDGGTLFVANTGAPYIVSLSGGSSGNQGTLRFDQYNSATLPSAPASAVDLNALEKGGGSA